MPDLPDQMRRGTNLTYYEAIVQALELWNRTPVMVLDEELARDYALLQAKGQIHHRTEAKRPARRLRRRIRFPGSPNQRSLTFGRLLV